MCTPKSILATSPYLRILKAISFASETKGEKCPQSSLVETHTGKAIPFSVFFLLYTFASSSMIYLSPNSQISTTAAPGTHFLMIFSRTELAILPAC